MIEIMQPGFEVYVRSLLGVDETELTDEELNSPIYEELAEATIKKRVPDYANVTDTVDLLYMQNATMYLVCALVCPSMGRRLNIDVTTLDVKWKKDKVDWGEKEKYFLGKVEDMLLSVTTVEVSMPDYDGSLVDYIRNTRNSIGGTQS